MMKLVLVCSLAITLSGCTIKANLNTGYRGERGLVRKSPVAGSLAVRKFTDERPPRVYTTGGRGFLTYVPFIPYVDFPFERLEESALKAGQEVSLAMPPFEQYAYPASMARAIAEDLADCGLFTTVQYVGDGSADQHPFVLSGTLRATPVEKALTSYGLGIAGVYLWILPIPVGQIWANVNLDLVLTERATGRELWKHTLTQEVTQWVSLYTSAPSLVFGGASSFDFPQVPRTAGVDRESLFSWHFELLRQAMKSIPAEMAAALPAQ